MFRMKRGWLAPLVVCSAVVLLWAGVPAGATPLPPGAVVLHCTGVAGELQQAIFNAAPGSTIAVDGTCVGGVYIDKSLTLAGPAIVDGADTDTTLVVAQGSVVVLNDLTLQHGNSPYQIGGGLGNNGQTTLNRSIVKENTADFGGGIFNTGQLTLNNSAVSDNTGSVLAGGIYNCGGYLGPFDCPDSASLTLNNSSVTGNGAPNGHSGGIFNDDHAVMAITNSTVSGNNAQSGGGGIVNGGTATISKSTLSGNTAFSGGAINNGLNWEGAPVTSASLTLTNSTVQGNTASLLGGAITTTGPLTITNSTVSGNRAGPFTGFGFVDAGFGGAIFIFSQATTVGYSTFSNNPATSGLDSPPGILVQPPLNGGSGTFSATHSTFS
jgi:hypothetical protein